MKFRLNMKILLAILLILLLIPLLFFTWVYLSIPSYEESMPIEPRPSDGSLNRDTLSLLVWNIGYAGLGKEMDFFFDGGKQVKAPRDESRRYLDGIKEFLVTQQDIDIFLLQEVDRASARSYHIDQAKTIADLIPSYASAFCLNYHVAFVPAPLTRPMGRVSSGLMTLSRATPAQVRRVALPGRYPHPKQWFMPYRCFLLTRFDLADGKTLMVLNIHNSAFDEGGKQREQQTAFLKAFVLEAYEKGYHVIAGGDWNQSPAGFDPLQLNHGDLGFTEEPLLKTDYFNGWQIAWGQGIPTNRALDGPYSRGETRTTIIDYYICSPNIELIETKTFDLGFVDSDHHPVKITLRMKQVKD